MKIGDYIQADSYDGTRRIIGEYVDDINNYTEDESIRMILQSNRKLAFIKESFYKIKVLPANKTPFEVQLQELIDQYIKDGNTKQSIIEGLNNIQEGLK